MLELKSYTNIVLIVLLIGCSTTAPPQDYTTPVEVYLSAKERAEKTGSSGDFSLDYLKSQAAMYLYHQAQVELKSGNSPLAVRQLSEARQYNPWHDDIKDLHKIATQILVKSTKNIHTANCEYVNERLATINRYANDRLHELNNLIEKCHFTPSKTFTFTQTKTTPVFKKIEQKIYSNYSSELENITQRNSYIPKQELLSYAINFISSIKFETSKIEIAEENDNKNAVTIFLPFKVKTEKKSSKGYCLEMEKLLSNDRYAKQSQNTPYGMAPDSLLECTYFNFWTGDKKIVFITLPKWHSSLKNIWPLPKEYTIYFAFKYKDQTQRIFKNRVLTHFSPSDIETGYGFLFKFIEGDLPFKIKDDRPYVEKTDNFLALEVNANELLNLDSVNIEIDLRNIPKL
ncbi:MAG: hypothetical protein K2Q26_07770 [Bdellovibrionales bacterium]|nr:hypothetical protein [Bdellovibrionales bacterium]